MGEQSSSITSKPFIRCYEPYHFMSEKDLGNITTTIKMLNESASQKIKKSESLAVTKLYSDVLQV